jgi:hypothetical protein
MRMYPSLADRTNTRLPALHWQAHELCFAVHDILLQLLFSGRRASAFTTTLELRDEDDRLALERADDIFEWLEQTRRVDDRATILVTTVFPEVLGDMLHCFYEALETSRKGKLTIAFMLLRKPLQESLFLLETILVDRRGFAEKMTAEPTKLYSQGAGGIDVHTQRIQQVLDLLGETDRYDAAYLAQLRYDKEAYDGFDGVCNKAMHLFTDHKAIRTEPLNINFIFSNSDTMLTQWSYLYSRLPYLLVYLHRLVEHVCADIAPTDPAYVEDMDRRISASVILWCESVKSPYDEPRLRTFLTKTRERLVSHCQSAGYRSPDFSDLARMAATGAFPGEPKNQVAARLRNFTLAAMASGSASLEKPPSLLTRFRSWLRSKI